jgi:hypothetical protein
MKGFLKNYYQPAFLVSITVLVVFAGGMSYFKAKQGVTLVKKALPLKQPFDMLDEKLLAPYKVLEKTKIENLDVIESLGTEEYMQWLVEDTTVEELSPVRQCAIFITYYTGNPDQVPHVPEACYTGGGNETKEKFSFYLNIGDVNSPKVPAKVPATGIIFGKKTTEIWQASAVFPVIYFFKVNGKYTGDRTTTRLALGNLTSEYSYFSKIELKFFNDRGLYPDKKQAIEATEKLLRVLLPALENNTWPEWK